MENWKYRKTHTTKHTSLGAKGDTLPKLRGSKRWRGGLNIPPYCCRRGLQLLSLVHWRSWNPKDKSQTYVHEHKLEVFRLKIRSFLVIEIFQVIALTKRFQETLRASCKWKSQDYQRSLRDKMMGFEDSREMDPYGWSELIVNEKVINWFKTRKTQHTS